MISPAHHAVWMQEEILRARNSGGKFSERNVLVVLSEAVLSGAAINADFQALANAVMAKAFISVQFPAKRAGRPKGSISDGNLTYDDETVAGEYFDLLDAGKAHSDCIDEMAKRHNKGTRQIERIIGMGSAWHGGSKAARDQKRREVTFDDHPYPPRADLPEQDAPIELARLSKTAALAKLQTAINPI